MSTKMDIIWDIASFCYKNNINKEKCADLVWSILNSAGQIDYDCDTDEEERKIVKQKIEDINRNILSVYLRLDELKV